METKLRPGSELTVFKYHRSKATFHELNGYDVVITTYSAVASEITRLNQCMGGDNGLKDGGTLSERFPLLGPQSLWYRVILDEAHLIKDNKTKNAKAAYRLESEYRWCLSGTPMMNSVTELSSLVTFLRIKPYCAADMFYEVSWQAKLRQCSLN